MFSDWKNMSIPFVGGLDTKTDSKLVSPPSLTVCQNAVFTKHGTLRRRYGYAPVAPREVTGALISSYRGLAVQGDQLLMQSAEKLYSYDALRARYLSRGSLPLLKIEQSAVTSTNSAQSFADVCTLSDVTVVAWEDSRGGVYASAYNASTGAAYVTEQLISAVGQGPMVVAFSGAIHLFYYNSSTGSIDLVRVNVAAVEVSLLAAPLMVLSDANASSGVFDVQAGTDAAYIAYLTDSSVSAATVRIARVESDGTPTAITDVASNANVTALAVATDGTTVYVAQLWNSGASIAVHWLTAALVINASTLAVTPAGSASTRIALAATSGVATVFYQQPQTAIGTYTPNSVQSFALTIATVTVGPTLSFRHSKLASRPYTHGGSTYVVVAHESTFQSSYFLLRADGLICGRANYGLASSQSTRTRLPTVQSLGSSRYQWAPRIKRRLDVDPNQKLAAAYTHDTATVQVFDWGHDVQAVESGGAAYIAAGLLWQFDGVSPVESGFLLFPEDVLLVPSTAAGALVSTLQYQYRVYWEWTSASGERERSAALPYTIYDEASTSTPKFTGGNNTITITVPSLWHTHKAGARSNAALVVYRTEGNGTVFHRCSSTDPTTTGSNGWVSNTTTANSVTFTDVMADTVLRTKELDYQNTGELENVAPAAGSLVARSQSRLFLAGGTSRPDTVFYSKLRTIGQPAGRFNEGLTIKVDEEGGPVTALGELSGSVVVFKRDRIYATSPADTGASNLGFGGYGTAQLINSDVGCSKPKTVCLTPGGLVFVAAKGVYLLGPNLQVQYIGAKVESFGTADIVSTTVLPLQNTIVFLTSTGTALTFNYEFGQWGTWTNHLGLDSVLWGDAFVYLDTTGRTMHQSTTSYSDGGVFYEMRARLAPIRPPEVQGIQEYWRAQRIQVIGNYMSSHELHIDVYRNREEYPIQSEVFKPDTVLNTSTWGSGTWGSGVWGGTGRREYKFDMRFDEQKCETLTLEFWDTPGTVVGAGYELTEIALKWALKVGLGQIAATRKV